MSAYYPKCPPDVNCPKCNEQHSLAPAHGSDAVELEQIKDALKTVLPGPWWYDHDGGVVWAHESVKPTPESNAINRVCDATGRWATHDPTHETQIKANLIFIAKCREWIPALVAEVERLRHQNAPHEPRGANH